MRRKLDQYFTPGFATRALLEHENLAVTHVYECCSGQNDIARELERECLTVVTNDIDPAMPAITHFDATHQAAWWGDWEWVISNPPFNKAAEIVPLAYESASIGIAMLLRLSYLEPCKDRADWLAKHPPSHLIVLPRISFTGDGKTDNVTCAWMVWHKLETYFYGPEQKITIVTKDFLKGKWPS